jgi:hypothetical protein
MRDRQLREWLSTFDGRLRDQVDRRVAVPRIRGKVSSAPAHWAMLASMDDMLAAWVEVDAICRLVHELNSPPGPRIETAYTVLPWIRATRSSLTDLLELGGDGWAVPPSDRNWFRVDISDLYIRALAMRLEHLKVTTTLADLFREGKRPAEWLAAKLLGLNEDRFSALAGTNTVEHARWVRLAGLIYYAAGHGLPAGSGRYIATRVTQDEAFVRAAEPSLRRLYEEVHPELLDYLRRVPDEDRKLDGAWPCTTGANLQVIGLNCLSARRIDFGTTADYLVQSLVAALFEIGFKIVSVTEQDVYVETESGTDSDLVAAVQDLTERTIAPLIDQVQVRCRVHPIALR